MGNKGLLTIIAVVLIGILTVVVIQIGQGQNNTSQQFSQEFENVDGKKNINTALN